jgi:hypothetical protein
MNPKKKSLRCRASVSIQALDLAISRFIHSPVCNPLLFMEKEFVSSTKVVIPETPLRKMARLQKK